MRERARPSARAAAPTRARSPADPPAAASSRAGPRFEAVPTLPPGARAAWSIELIPPQPPAPGPPIQRVGGAKFGLEVVGDRGDPQVAEGIARLRAAQAALKAAMRRAKDDALRTQQQAAAAAALLPDEADQRAAQIEAQTAFTRALADAEMTPEQLVAQAGAGFALAAGVITFHDIPIARVHRGGAAYVQSAAAAGPGFSAVYKRHSLGGQSARDYVSDGAGNFLRRTAYRGITPPERGQLARGEALTPLNAHRRGTPELGYNFDHDGRPVARDADKGTDLGFLGGLVGRNVAASPNNAEVRAYLQTRKGVGKYFSATSTPRAITSNHDAGFTERGQITFDLARVPQAELVHHYKGRRFDAARINAATGGHGAAPARLVDDVARGNETVLRNRELVLGSIPAEAVTALDGATRAEFVGAFPGAFTRAAAQTYRAVLRSAGLPFVDAILDGDPNLAPPATPPGVGALQGQMAGERAGAGAGKAAAVAVIDEAIAFVDAYERAYSEGYIDGYYTAAGEAADQDAPAPDAPRGPPPTEIPVDAGRQTAIEEAQAAGDAAGYAAYGQPATSEGEEAEEAPVVVSSQDVKGKGGKGGKGKGKGGRGKK